MANNEYIETLARLMTGKLGGKALALPHDCSSRSWCRTFWIALINTTSFDFRVNYQLTVSTSEMISVEREAQAKTVDDIELDL
ncbi:MAG: hypothetical protein R3C11_24755 [Planctomycetaceae bacterium]